MVYRGAAIEFPRASRYGYEFYKDALEKKYGRPYRPTRTTANFKEVLWKTPHWGIVLHKDHVGSGGRIMYVSVRHFERLLDQLRDDEEKRKAKILDVL